jgi:hypothetical protein
MLIGFVILLAQCVSYMYVDSLPTGSSVYFYASRTAPLFLKLSEMDLAPSVRHASHVTVQTSARLCRTLRAHTSRS